MHPMPIVTVEAAEDLLAAIDDLLEKSEGDFAMVIDRGGTILSEHGKVPDSTDTTIVAALAAGSFAATKELATRIGEPEFSALYQQGARCHILMNAVDDDSVLVTVFGPKTTVGLVRFYSARAIVRIGAVLRELRSSARMTPVFSEDDVDAASQIFVR
jgi:predicted regulator of Ras-like GTPase activity (Roadblock/LC7/MglB family)